MLTRSEHSVPEHEHFVAMLNNGLKISVVRHPHSYGNRNGEGLWEMAIFDEFGEKLEFQNGIVMFLWLSTCDVTGWVTFDQCEAVAKELANWNRAKVERVATYLWQTYYNHERRKLPKRLYNKRFNAARRACRRFERIMKG